MRRMEVSPPTLQLRLARPADVAKIAQCYVASCKALLPFAPLGRSEAEVAGWLGGTVMARSNITVAIESGAVVGFIAVARRPDCDWIDLLHVHPARLRRGVGSTLLQVALMRLTGTVRLYTYEENRGGRKFCERYGFAAVAFGDGSSNESGDPDVLYERAAPATP
jgi:GNAT superfamily N-acetyltransferase